MKERTLPKFGAELVFAKEGKFFIVVKEERIEPSARQVVKLLGAFSKKDF